MRQSLKSIVTMALAIACTNCIMFKLASNQPTCLRIPADNTYVVEYVVSGQNDNNVRMQAFLNDQPIFAKEKTNDLRTTISFGPGTAKVCFERTDGSEKSISFDYYPEADPLREIIDKKDLKIAYRSLGKAMQTLKEVGRNQRYHIERNEINKMLLEESESKIKWAGIIKIFFLITSALIQLWIMKSFFNRNSVPYQPVDQS